MGTYNFLNPFIGSYTDNFSSFPLNLGRKAADGFACPFAGGRSCNLRKIVALLVRAPCDKAANILGWHFRTSFGGGVPIVCIVGVSHLIGVIVFWGLSRGSPFFGSTI